MKPQISTFLVIVLAIYLQACAIQTKDSIDQRLLRISAEEEFEYNIVAKGEKYTYASIWYPDYAHYMGASLALPKVGEPIYLNENNVSNVINSDTNIHEYSDLQKFIKFIYVDLHQNYYEVDIAYIQQHLSMCINDLLFGLGKPNQYYFTDHTELTILEFTTDKGKNMFDAKVVNCVSS